MLDVRIDEATGLEFWDAAEPEDVQSPIWKLWQEGTQHHFAWPCPCCGAYFIPRFSCLKWDHPDGLKVTPAEARRSAYIACPRCGGVIKEEHKADMNARGLFVAPGQRIVSVPPTMLAAKGTSATESEKSPFLSTEAYVEGDPPDSSTISFWVSGLCSPFVTFGVRAEAFLQAVRNGGQEAIQGAINTGFGGPLSAQLEEP